MILQRQSARSEARRGVILMVVLALLTLFALIGVSFVLYADAEATAARINREGESRNRPDIDPELALSLFLGQMIYDVPDDANGVYSGLRGQSLARSMYGWFDTANALNDKPFTGTGRLHYNSPLNGATGYAADDSYLVNFTFFSGDGFLRDPERYPSRANLAAARGTYTGGFNVPYTYPDHQNIFLAMMRASDGQVLVPSFHRSWLWGGKLSDQTNANWTNAAGKYLTLRPRPADMGTGFPYPEDDGGDVKNWDGGPGGNDSIWIDINAPVMTAPNGQKYKMLVAPLIIELDGRINLNVIGNILGLDANNNIIHASNQGWGAFEVNVSKVLNAGGAPREWTNVFLGSPSTGKPHVLGRYGVSRIPQGTTIPAWPFTPRLYAGIDFNSTLDPAPGTLTTAIELPSTPGVNTKPYQCFPYFPNGYGNGAATEINNAGNTPIHPLIYNSLRPTLDNRLLPLPSLAALIRYSGTGSEALTSDLLRLCPTNFVTDTAAMKRRNLVTLLSADLDRVGAIPYVWDPNDQSNPTTRYQFNTTSAVNNGITTWSPLYPFQTQPIAFPALSTRANAVPAGSEFDSNTWRSTLGQLLRLNVNRPLSPYPAPYPTPGRLDLTNAAVVNQLKQAIADRQQFANDLFNALQKATGTLPINTAAGLAPALNAPEYRALRWLAQLAVNIVDAIDQDDHMTPFQWDPTNNPKEFLFGTELPRLLINEAYIQLDNNPIDPFTGGKATLPYNVNTWVELCNPLITENAATNPNQAILQDATGPIYQLLFTDPTPAGNLPNIRNPANVLGNPDYGLAMGQTNVKSTVNNWSAALPQFVASLNNAYNDPSTTNQGFYVAGPLAANYLAANNPNLTTTTLAAGMTYTVPLEAAMQPAPSAAPTILLQRLACPGLPLQTDPTLANYNPYVTVDYVESYPSIPANGKLPGGAASTVPVPHVFDTRKFNANGANTRPANQLYASWGRNQPYASANGQMNIQNPNPAPATSPLNTFYRHNAVEGTAPPSPTTAGQTLKVPFDWLVQIDRQVIGPTELLHISAFKPHELTQQFYDPTSRTAFSHSAPWFDQRSRLYRFLELIQTSNRANGIRMGGRIPGRININAVWDKETFEALCDAQAGNAFTQAQVDTLFNALVQQRSPTTDGSTGFMPGSADQPFWSLATGMAAGGDALDPNTVTNPGSPKPRGIANTLLRGVGGPPIPPPPPIALDPLGAGNHPYLRYQLLTKVFNNLTARSNVFAVWLTVGFFEVAKDANGNYTGDQSQPVKLGAEIGRSEGRQIRHRMFAIVDRTNLQVLSTTSTAAITVPASPYGGQTSAPGTSIQLAQMSGTNTAGQSWQVQAGTVLVYEPNTDNEETVVVQAGPPLQATFLRSHANGVQVISRGNPGPWPRYNSRQDPTVVPYFAVID